MIRITTITHLIVLAAAAAAAQGPILRGPFGPFNPATLMRLEGRVIDVQTTRRDGAPVGTHIVLDTDGEEIVVHLGPAWYMEAHGLALKPGDHLEVSGSRVEMNGRPYWSGPRSR